MAEHTITFFERRAIWEAHGKRCVYCREPLSFAQLEIDHILPETLLNDADQRNHICTEHGLSASFDAQGYENLAPSCRSCNARKGAAVLPPGRIAIELSVASRLEDHVAARVKRFEEADNADKLRFSLASAIESGQLTELEVSRLLSATRANTGVFQLSSIYSLWDDQPAREISRTDSDRYLGLRVPLPVGMNDGLRLISNNDTEVRVSTLREYREAIARGFFACSTFEMDVAFQRFERPLALLHILMTVKLADQSFIDDPRVGLADASLVPATLLFVTEDMTSDPAFAGQRAKLEGKSIQDLLSTDEATVTRVGSELLGVEYNDCRTFMFEMMRGDMNADGIEDMLIHWGGGPVDGTYRAGSVVVLTRRSQEEMFSTVAVQGLTTTR